MRTVRFFFVSTQCTWILSVFSITFLNSFNWEFSPFFLSFFPNTKCTYNFFTRIGLKHFVTIAFPLHNGHESSTIRWNGPRDLLLSLVFIWKCFVNDLIGTETIINVSIDASSLFLHTHLIASQLTHAVGVAFERPKIIKSLP